MKSKHLSIKYLFPFAIATATISYKAFPEESSHDFCDPKVRGLLYTDHAKTRLSDLCGDQLSPEELKMQLEKWITERNFSSAAVAAGKLKDPREIELWKEAEKFDRAAYAAEQYGRPKDVITSLFLEGGHLDLAIEELKKWNTPEAEIRAILLKGLEDNVCAREWRQHLALDSTYTLAKKYGVQKQLFAITAERGCAMDMLTVLNDDPEDKKRFLEQVNPLLKEKLRSEDFTESTHERDEEEYYIRRRRVNTDRMNYMTRKDPMGALEDLEQVGAWDAILDLLHSTNEPELIDATIKWVVARLSTIPTDERTGFVSEVSREVNEKPVATETKASAASAFERLGYNTDAGRIYASLGSLKKAEALLRPIIIEAVSQARFEFAASLESQLRNDGAARILIEKQIVIYEESQDYHSAWLATEYYLKDRARADAYRALDHQLRVENASTEPSDGD